MQRGAEVEVGEEWSEYGEKERKANGEQKKEKEKKDKKKLMLEKQRKT